MSRLSKQEVLLYLINMEEVQRSLFLVFFQVCIILVLFLTLELRYEKIEFRETKGRSYWNDLNNIRQFLLEFAKENSITNIEDWTKVSKKQVIIFYLIYCLDIESEGRSSSKKILWKFTENNRDCFSKYLLKLGRYNSKMWK